MYLLGAGGVSERGVGSWAGEICNKVAIVG